MGPESSAESISTSDTIATTTKHHLNYSCSDVSHLSSARWTVAGVCYYQRLPYSSSFRVPSKWPRKPTSKHSLRWKMRIPRSGDVYFTGFSSASTFFGGQANSTENPARTSYMYTAPKVFQLCPHASASMGYS